ncbi:LuxR C-terminal-related transcriptional regulator [Conexibacter stalactiti]|uniref:LuxR C-terminal-related transcriptional regulator n=1 Tax=Conexibacter stalactiti TaxID=1940611 RepID=A0ABU4HNI5_9ACTN|nr:LuxR C-terminal-related transcriptional regulator [Conexibacter stalactiti]MDW5594868.1 LuxR C-terminal-related transcriptional regulator [Conexibacter stalactiti]MEC5035510.1 LuxR C-terminal-related transcriptional regulator [Conexibacter stalactiti]
MRTFRDHDRERYSDQIRSAKSTKLPRIAPDRVRTPLRISERGAVALIGREQELARIDAAIAGPTAGAIVLRGPAGVGKTRLAREAARKAGGAAHWVVATESVATIPFGAVAALLPERADAVAHRHDLLSAAASALRDAGGELPPLVVVDDAHLLDPGSAALVLHLAVSRVASLVVTVRDGTAAPDAITALWKDGHAECADLHLLTPAEAATLAETLLGGPCESRFLAWAWARTEGNALFATELLHGLRESGALARDHGLWQLADPDVAVPAGLAELLRTRISELDGAAQRLLELVAVAEPFERALAAELGGADALDELERLALVTTVRDGRRLLLRLSHPLYGDLLRARQSPGRRADLVGQLAAAVAQTGARREADVLRVVEWRLEIGLPVSADALLAAANIGLRNFDHALARRLAQLACEQGGGLEAALAWARSATATGAFEEVELALAPFDGAHDDPLVEAEAIRLRSSALQWGLRQGDAALELLDAAQERWPGDAWRARIQALRIAVLADRGEMSAAVRVGREALATAGLPPGLRREITAQLAFSLHLDGFPDESRELIDAIVDFETPDSVDWRLLWPWLVTRLRGAAAFAETDAQLHALRDAAAGNMALSGLVALSLGTTAWYQGRMRTGMRWLGEAVSSYDDADPRAMRPAALLMLARCAFMVGEHETAREAAAEARRASSGRPLEWIEIVPVSFANVLEALAEGRIAEARRLALDSSRACRTVPVHEAELLHLALRIGALPSPIAQRLDAIATAASSDQFHLFAIHARALASGDGAALARVSAEFERAGELLLAAEAGEHAAEALRQAGALDRAASAAARSAALLEACEGARLPFTHPPGTVLDELTRREREVAGLVAAGYANAAIGERLVISVRTVEVHVLRACRKLGVRDRHALAELIR